MALEMNIASNWIIGGLLTLNLSKPFLDRFFKGVDTKGSKVEEEIVMLKKEVGAIKLALAEKVSRDEFNKLMTKLSEIEGYLKAKQEEK